MYLTAEGSTLLPATLLPLVLLLQPRSQRFEVLQQGIAVHLPLACHDLERVGPRLARAQGEHLPQLRARLLAAVERAFVQRALVSGRLAHRAIELELQDAGEEIPRIGGV